MPHRTSRHSAPSDSTIRSPTWLPSSATARRAFTPVRPAVARGRLFVFMESTSPKVGDLARDTRYALHGTATSNQPWDLREFAVEGAAHRVDDLPTRTAANAGSAFPRDERFLLFELDVETAISTVYGADGRPHRQRWRRLTREPR